MRQVLHRCFAAKSHNEHIPIQASNHTHSKCQSLGTSPLHSLLDAGAAASSALRFSAVTGLGTAKNVDVNERELSVELLTASGLPGVGDDEAGTDAAAASGALAGFCGCDTNDDEKYGRKHE